MNKNYKKYIAFLLYVGLISVPILYWINASWGLSVLSRKQVFASLLAGDFSFILTIISGLGALTVGIAAILLKQSQNVQTEHEIYVANSMVEKNSDGNFISTNEFIAHPKPAEIEPVPADTGPEKAADSPVVRPSQALNANREFIVPKAPPPAMKMSDVEMNFIVPEKTNPYRQGAPDVSANKAQNIVKPKNISENPPEKPSKKPPAKVAAAPAINAPEIRIEKEPVINASIPENNSEQPDVGERKYFEKILKEKGYKTFDVKSIDGFDVKFFAVSNKNILFGYSMPFDGDIIANETIPEDSTDTHPYWFSQTTRFMSPIFAVKHIRKSIDDLMLEVLPENHDITIESYCLLHDDAKILNMVDMQNIWNDDIINVVMNSRAFENIPCFDTAVEDNTTTEIMPKFLEFAETMSKYFIQRARIAGLKKHS